MTNEVKNVPELRFPEFDEEWEKKVLGEISNRVKRKNTNSVSKMPLTISGSLGLVDQITYFSKSVSAKNLDNYTLIKNGEFAYNKSYSNGYPLGAIKRLERYDQGALSTLYICFKFNDSQSSEFMKHYFESDKWYKEVSQIAVEGARNHGLLNIPVNDFFSINLFTPMLTEQQKIGEFFSKLDQQIELEEQKLAKLEEQKKGYMQKIFSQQLRFKDENGNDYPKWENKQLGNLVDITMGQSPSSKNYTENSNYTTLVQGNADLNNGYIEPRIYTKQITKLAEVNDILLTVRAPVGKIGRAQLKACIGRGVCAIKGDSFIYYFLELFDLQNKWIRFSQGSTFESISGNEIKNIDIAYPVNEERQKISEFLSKLDKLLKNQLLKVEQLKQRKQGLLQKMFI